MDSTLNRLSGQLSIPDSKSPSRKKGGMCQRFCVAWAVWTETR